MSCGAAPGVKGKKKGAIFVKPVEDKIMDIAFAGEIPFMSKEKDYHHLRQQLLQKVSEILCQNVL